MVLIVWIDGEEDSQNSNLTRLRTAHLVYMDDRIEDIKTIVIEGTAPDSAGDKKYYRTGAKCLMNSYGSPMIFAGEF